MLHDLKTVIENGDRLDSWKAIAEYLGRDRTTVMRWARTAALPVRHIAGGRSVFAYKSDLDRWLAGGSRAAAEMQPESAPAASEPPPPMSHPRPQLRRRQALSLALVFGCALALAVWSQGGGGPVTTVAFVGQQIVARDAAGADLWRHEFRDLEGTVAPARLLVTDIDDDGGPDVLAALQVTKRGRHGDGLLMAFDGRGRVRWERTVSERYRFGDEEYAPPWYPEDVIVYHAGEVARIAVALHHHTWWPGLVVTYDAGGQPIDRFVSAGWVRHLNVTADGRYLLAAGLSNAFGGAALAVLDAARPGGASPAADGALPGCTNCPAGSPVAYFVAPWSALAHPSDTPHAVVQVDEAGGIEWHALQRGGGEGKAPDIIIGLSPRLEFVRWDVNNYFTDLQGPQAHRPVVRRWTPAHGWQDVSPP